MQIVRLHLMTASDLKELASFKSDCLSMKQPIHGSYGLGNTKDNKKWAQNVLKNKSKKNQYLFLARNEQDRLVGLINYKSTLTAYETRMGGHVSYTVHPLYQGKGYAKEMLATLIQWLRDGQITEHILLTVDNDNQASNKVIQANKGKYQNSIILDHKRINRYTINIYSEK